MLGTDFILDALAREGLKHLFLVPGGLIDPFLPALGRQSAIMPVLAAHEGGAAFMADGYARASGGIGGILCIGGPGLGNTVTAVAAASTDGSPVLVISGEVETCMEGRGVLQDASSQTLDDVSTMRPLTRYSSSVPNPQNLPHILRRALAQLRSEPTAPVHLSVPLDAQTAPIEAAYQPLSENLVHARMLSLDAAEASLAHVKAEAGGTAPQRIVILAGAGVEHAHCASQLRRFAERWDIPVATTLRAKGVFPEDHPLSLGVFGFAGTHHARMALLDSPPDLLIVLGSGLNERDTMKCSLPLTPFKTICVNLDVAAMAEHPSGSSIRGDAGAYLAWLETKPDVIGPPLEAARARRREWLAGIRAQPRLENPESCTSGAVPIHPARAIAALRNVLPRDGIVLPDSGAHLVFAGHYWQSYEPLTFVSAANFGPMGWAIGAAIGVQFARPDRKVAVITGDGCMRMQGMEVATAARYGLSIVYLVINNAALGNVWLRAHSEGPVPAELTSLPDHDWAAFADAMGAAGITVTEPGVLEDAFDAAMKHHGPTVIDVKADKVFLTPIGDWVQATGRWSYHE